MKKMRPALIVLLVAVLIAGLWLLTRGRGPSGPSGPQTPVEAGDAGEERAAGGQGAPAGTATHPLEPQRPLGDAPLPVVEPNPPPGLDSARYDNEGIPWSQWCRQMVGVSRFVEELEAKQREAQRKGSDAEAEQAGVEVERARAAKDAVRRSMAAAGRPPEWAMEGHCQ